jgi:prephenate dehydrogenase
MKTDFPTITILGGGLLGGSLALALAALNDPPKVYLWVRNPETVKGAKALGISGVTTDLHEAVLNASLVILAVPVGAMEPLLTAALDAGLPAKCLITDVGSIKRLPHQKISHLLLGREAYFIGSHPMAGSERNGLAAASAQLFNNAACLLTNDNAAPAESAAALDRFWKSVGCRTAWMSAAVHDELVARISHLPHLIAASAARVCLKDPSEGRFGGGGLRDTTRVAAGNPEMWAEIVTENREALVLPIKETIADLQEILTCLEKGDHEKTLEWLHAAKQQRDTLNQLF